MNLHRDLSEHFSFADIAAAAFIHSRRTERMFSEIREREKTSGGVVRLFMTIAEGQSGVSELIKSIAERPIYPEQDRKIDVFDVHLCRGPRTCRPRDPFRIRHMMGRRVKIQQAQAKGYKR
jgi:hypothetical protein